MSRSSLLILFGMLTALTPFAGLPSSWVAVFVPLFGIIVAVVGFSIRVQKVRESMAQEPSAQLPEVATQAPSVPSHGVSPI